MVIVSLPVSLLTKNATGRPISQYLSFISNPHYSKPFLSISYASIVCSFNISLICFQLFIFVVVLLCPIFEIGAYILLSIIIKFLCSSGPFTSLFIPGRRHYYGIVCVCSSPKAPSSLEHYRYQCQIHRKEDLPLKSRPKEEK